MAPSLTVQALARGIPLQLVCTSEERKRTNWFLGILLAAIIAIIAIAATTPTAPASLAISLQRAQQVYPYMQHTKTDGEKQVNMDQQILVRL